MNPLTTRCSDSTGLGNPEKDLPGVKVWCMTKASLRAQTSPLLPGYHVAVAIHASRAQAEQHINCTAQRMQTEQHINTIDVRSAKC